MCTILVAAVALVASSLIVSAQSVSVNRIEISSDAARRMVEARLAWADKSKVAVGVAVLGIDGVLIDCHLLQGAAATIQRRPF